MRHLLVSFVFLLAFTSCKVKQIADYKGNNYPIQDTTFSTNDLDTIINPYKSELEVKMNEVIGTANQDLVNGPVENPLGNFVADVVFESGFKFKGSLKAFDIQKTNTFALLNFGGLRASINKGTITIGNIYELMPFDNEIVIVKLTPSKIEELLTYLFQKNGQPIANAIAYLNSSKGKLDIGGSPYNFTQDVYVITSDYLANGGDKMNFFKGAPFFKTGILMRDALINYVKTVKTLPEFKVEGRIQQIR
ncbi:MAG: 5'-nucleotidase C-terminal domain-containing protein [Putridiphycobacter sp.]